MKNKITIAIVLVVVLILFLKRKSIMMYDILSSLLQKFEGFSAFPYWDVKRYSWGYGTAVPAKYLKDGKPLPGVQISRSQAFIDAFNHVESDKAYLQRLIKVPLSPEQWAAYLSFSYNLGDGNADNLVTNINAKKWDALGVQWNQYVIADGKRNSNLVARRKAEWELFKSHII